MKKRLLPVLLLLIIFSVYGDSINHDGIMKNACAVEKYNPNETSDKEILMLAVNFIQKIRSGTRFSASEEREFFGCYGGCLGQSTYDSMGLMVWQNSTPFFSLKESVRFSPVGDLLIEKLTPLLREQEVVRFFISGQTFIFCAIPPKAEYQNEVKIVTIRTSRNKMCMWDQGTTLILYIVTYSEKSKGRQKHHSIDLVNCVIGNISLPVFLGFSGKFASDFKLNRQDAQMLKKLVHKPDCKITIPEKHK